MSRPIRIAAIIWGASVLASRVIGLFREAAVGRILGAGRAADVYQAAFLVPDFLNYLLAAGALTLVFLPMFGAYLARGEESKGWESFSVIASFLAVVLGVLVVALWIAMPALVAFAAPGIAGPERDHLVRLSRILLPAQIFHVLGGLLSASLLARDRHSIPALAPLVYSASIVAGGLAARSAEGFAWGVLAGSALGPFLLPLAGNLRAGMRWRFTLAWGHPDLATYLRRSLVIMLGLSIVVVDDWIVIREGSFLGEGAIAALRYAKNLIRVPMGVFGLAAGAATFPTLVRLVAAGETDRAYRTLGAAVRMLLVPALGCQVVFTAAGPEISAVVFGGRIEPETHRTIGDALAILSIGLWAWASHAVVARGFYALHRTWFPTVLGTAVAVLAYPLYRYLAREHGVLGLPVATSIAISAYVLLLVLALRREFRGSSDGLGAFAIRIAPAIALGIAAGRAVRLLELPGPLLAGTAAAGVAGAVFVATGLVLGPPEVRSLASIALSRLPIARRLLQTGRREPPGVGEEAS